MSEPEFKLDDSVTERDLLFRIARELTTIRQPISQMARAATAMLIEHVRARQRGNMPEPEICEFPFSLVRRNSDAPPRATRKRRTQRG